MNWTGLRGVVASALALSIPEGPRDRELLQAIVFGVVLFTLLEKGTTAARVLRWARIEGVEEASAAEAPPEV
jgi:CPA1 family monovalent cation:H+ antiporter